MEILIIQVSIPRGIAYRPNGHVNYYYPNTEEGRTAAIAEITIIHFNYKRMAWIVVKNCLQCTICHGEKADGAGYLVRDEESILCNLLIWQQ